jgi:hypothetical protein
MPSVDANAEEINTQERVKANSDKADTDPHHELTGDEPSSVEVASSPGLRDAFHAM